MEGHGANGARNGRRAAVVAGGALAAGAGALWLAKRARQADVTGEVAIVTGGSRGLGFLLARELGRAGCRVAITARDAEELDRAREELARDGLEVVAVPADVSAQDQVARLVDEVEERLGPVDVLVNNAGIIHVGPVESLGTEDFQRAMNVMYWGVVYPTLHVLPGMRERGKGRIVNITSIGGKIAAPHLLPYSSAKFAAVGFSEGLTSELAGSGVTVTTIAPGFMRTGSPVNALFTGADARKPEWFVAADSVPGVSMSAERAARQIVRAMRRGRVEKHLTWWAPLASRFHGLFPALTVRLNGLINRLMPRGPGGETLRGKDALARSESRVPDAAIAPTLEAARRHNEYPGPTPGAHGRGPGRTPVRET